MPTTIEAGGAGMTLIVTYLCAEEKQAELIAAIDSSVDDLFAKQPGFISSSVHAGLDRTRVLNYVQWERVEDFDAAGQVPEIQERVAQFMALVESADPRLYKVSSVHHV
jgi:hypothetical protein